MGCTCRLTHTDSRLAPVLIYDLMTFKAIIKTYVQNFLVQKICSSDNMQMNHFEKQRHNYKMMYLVDMDMYVSWIRIVYLERALVKTEVKN